MTKQMMDYVLAYADIYDMDKCPITEIINHVETSFEAAHDGDEQDNFFNEKECINEFVEHYNSMKENFLDDEVKELVESGMDFITACEDWDI